MHGTIEVGLLTREAGRRREVLQGMQKRLQRQEEIEGLRWWNKAKDKDEQEVVREKYGQALDRYYQRVK